MNSEPKTAKPSDSHVQSFARGLAVIRSFNAQRTQQTLSDVAAATGLTRAGARRILLTLQGLGYVSSQGRQFSLTPKILDLGFAFLSSQPLWHLAEPVMQALTAKIHESCSMAVLEGGDIVYLLRVPAGKIMSINLGVGSRLPAYCTSMGRVLLAGLDEASLAQALSQHELAARTPRTLTRLSDLKAELRRVRERGYCIVDQELEEGLISIAAPIVDRNGAVVAALNISGSSHRTPEAEVVKQFLPQLLSAAAEISQLLKATR